MERLTQASNSGGVAFTFDLDITYQPSEARKILNLATKLKEYEDLEEQGRLIKLPCKVGDTVYEITGATTRGYDWKYLTYEKAYVHGTVFNLGRLNDIGKTVFLTKSEAEAKLKELRGKNE
jgi:hypothetical protein